MMKNSIGWRQANTRSFWQELKEDVKHAATHKGTALDTVCMWCAAIIGCGIVYVAISLMGKR